MSPSSGVSADLPLRAVGATFAANDPSPPRGWYAEDIQDGAARAPARVEVADSQVNVIEEPPTVGVRHGLPA
jgi:hypothetical protein